MKNLRLKNLIFVIFILLFIFLFSYANTQKIVEYNKPAVVLIYMDISGNVTFNVPRVNENAINQLQNEIMNLAYSGAFGTTEEEMKKNITKYIFQKMVQNPTRYLVPSKRQKSVQVNTGAVGSGVVINPNGYILTATHVVSMEEEELKKTVAQKFLSSVITEELFYNFEQEAGIELSQEEEKLLASAVLKYLLSNITSINYDKKIYVGLGVAEKGKSNVGAFFKPATIIKLGSSEKVSDIVDMGRDIAIIKIDQNNLPVSLVSEVEPTEASEIVVIGYPAKVHFFAGNLFDNFTILKPTVTKGIVSAIRTSNKGVRVIQTDATVSGGNSGGPAYNDEGKIIGTVSWGILDPQIGVATQNYNILVSCQEINNFLKEAGVQNVQSEVDINYRKAIDAYFEQKYRTAQNYFKKVEQLYPDHPYVKEYLVNCQTNIDQGKDRSGINLGSNTTIILIIVGLLFCGGIFLLSVAVTIYFIFFRKKPASK
ncbi:MAG: trypsin-like peptidase domain-containing protein [bacterium]